MIAVRTKCRVGTYATDAGEPRQDRKVAAVNFDVLGAVGMLALV